MSLRTASEPAHIVLSHWVHPEITQLLQTHGVVTANPARESWPRDELLAKTRTAHALMAFMPDRIDEEFLLACPQLRIIAGTFKGFDNVDVAACSRRHVWVTIVPDLLTEPTAELALALLLALLRRVLPGDRRIRERKFNGWRPVLYGQSLRGAPVGIIGMGAVGQSVAQKLNVFSPIVRYYDPRPLSSADERRLNVASTSLDDLLAWAGVLIVSLPLTETSLNLLNSRRLAQIRPGAYLVNVGRGSVVDEEAVAAALSRGHLAGYAADVFAFEDLSRTDRPTQIPAALLDNTASTVLTPHLGSAVDDVRRLIALSAAENIIDWLQGRSPRHAVNLPSRTVANEP
jgi:phosphonate dehydrogenase